MHVSSFQIIKFVDINALNGSLVNELPRLSGDLRFDDEGIVFSQIEVISIRLNLIMNKPK